MNTLAFHAPPRQPQLPQLVRDCGYVLATTWLFYLLLTATSLGLAAAGGMQPVLITSGSMQPTIETGDIMLTLPPDRLEPDIGRVITYDTPTATTGAGSTRLVSHRIIDQHNNMWVTAGDANTQPDTTPVDDSQILGTGRLLLPHAGQPILWINTQAWLPLALFLTGTALAGWAAHRFFPRAPDNPKGHEADMPAENQSERQPVGHTQ